MEKEIIKIYNDVLKNVIYPILGKKITWGDDLTRMGYKLFGKNYAGTFSSDKIPNLGFINNGIFKIPITEKNVKSNSKLYACINLDNSFSGIFVESCCSISSLIAIPNPPANFNIILPTKPSQTITSALPVTISIPSMLPMKFKLLFFNI